MEYNAASNADLLFQGHPWIDMSSRPAWNTRDPVPSNIKTKKEQLEDSETITKEIRKIQPIRMILEMSY